MAAKQLAARKYGQNKFAGMSVLEKVRFTMDVAMTAANEGDANRLRQALAVLKAGVNFEGSPVTALGFMRLYVHCERALEEREDFAEVARVISTLRRAWNIAEFKQENSPAPTDGES
jgi:hypothetical protein